MPANKNAMTRYKILDDLLSNRYRSYSIDDLTREVNKRLEEIAPESAGVCRRTIEKDLQYLEYESPFMVDIERYTADGYSPKLDRSYRKKYLRYADPSYSIFKKALNADEEYLLREVLSLLGHLEGLPELDGLDRLKQGLTVENRKQRIISFDRNIRSSSSTLGQLFSAISHRVVVRLHYHIFAEPEIPRAVTVSPYLLKEYNRRWFAIVGAEQDGAVLCFALDRIDEVEPLPAHTYIDYPGDVEERYREVIGVTLREESPRQLILLWVSDFSMDYVSTKPLHESQREIAGEEEAELRKRYTGLTGGRFFEICLRENYELLRELSSFGEHLVVLSPKSIRQEIARRIEAMEEAYRATAE